VELDVKDSALATKSASALIYVNLLTNVLFQDVLLDKTETDANSPPRTAMTTMLVLLTLVTLLLDVSTLLLLAMIIMLVLLILVSLLLDADSFPEIVLNLIHVSLMDVLLLVDVTRLQSSVIDVPSTMLLAPRLTARLTLANLPLDFAELLTRTVTITTFAPMMDVMLPMINAPTLQSLVMMVMPVPLILVTQLLDVLTPQLILPLVMILPFVPLILAILKLDVLTHQSVALLLLFARLLLVTLSWDAKKPTKTVDLS